MSPTTQIWISLLAMAGISFAFTYATKTYHLLWDGQTEDPQALPAYSLSRSQMLFWTLNILCGFQLALMGISGTAYLGLKVHA